MSATEIPIGHARRLLRRICALLLEGLPDGVARRWPPPVARWPVALRRPGGGFCLARAHVGDVGGTSRLVAPRGWLRCGPAHGSRCSAASAARSTRSTAGAPRRARCSTSPSPAPTLTSSASRASWFTTPSSACSPVQGLAISRGRLDNRPAAGGDPRRLGFQGPGYGATHLGDGDLARFPLPSVALVLLDSIRASPAGFRCQPERTLWTGAMALSPLGSRGPGGKGGGSAQPSRHSARRRR